MRNDPLYKFLYNISRGTETGLDTLETALALAVAQEYGFIRRSAVRPDASVITPSGRKWMGECAMDGVVGPIIPARPEPIKTPLQDRAKVVSTIREIYELRNGVGKDDFVRISRAVTPLMLTAILRLEVNGEIGREDFEAQHEIPARSVRILVDQALEMIERELAQ